MTKPTISPTSIISWGISLLFFIFLGACTTSSSEETATDPQTAPDNATAQEKISPQLQEVLDAAQVKGAIIIYDPVANTYYSNDFDWARQRRLPASTFKVPNSMIGLESGVVESDSMLFRWNGEKRALSAWEQDLNLGEAFRVSCVPCYQEIARKVGLKQMNDWLKKLGYPGMQVGPDNIDRFWLEGDSRISQFEQIDFLQRFYKEQLPLSARTLSIMRIIMLIDETDNYRLSGKTGWAIRNGHNNGWFIGFLETQAQVYFFATNIDPQASFDMDLFPKIRTQITMEALRELGLME